MNDTSQKINKKTAQLLLLSILPASTSNTASNKENWHIYDYLLQTSSCAHKKKRGEYNISYKPCTFQYQPTQLFMEDACLIQCGFSLGEHWLKWEITNNMFNKSADKRGWFVSVPTFFVEVLLLLVLIKDISSNLPQTHKWKSWIYIVCIAGVNVNTQTEPERETAQACLDVKSRAACWFRFWRIFYLHSWHISNPNSSFQICAAQFKANVLWESKKKRKKTYIYIYIYKKLHSHRAMSNVRCYETWDIDNINFAVDDVSAKKFHIPQFQFWCNENLSAK